MTPTFENFQLIFPPPPPPPPPTPMTVNESNILIYENSSPPLFAQLLTHLQRPRGSSVGAGKSLNGRGKDSGKGKSRTRVRAPGVLCPNLSLTHFDFSLPPVTVPGSPRMLLTTLVLILDLSLIIT